MPYTRPGKRLMRRLLFIAFSLAQVATASVANADPRTVTDWERAFVEGRTWAASRGGADGTALPDAPSPQTKTLVPRFTIVARDWGESHRLFGPGLSLTDVQRVSRSTRVVVSRLSLTGGSFSP